MKKKILSLSLASTLLLATVSFANNEQVVISEALELDKKEVISIQDDLEEGSHYINHRGKITEVSKEDGIVSIIVDDKETLIDDVKGETKGKIKFNIGEETILLTDENQDFIESDQLLEGSYVQISYARDSAMTKSLPPMTNADVVVVRKSNEDDGKYLGIKVDRFDEEQTSADNYLRFNITDETLIVDRNGEKIEDPKLADKDLIVFYGPIMTMSIPAQSGAVKIIVLDSKAEIETPEKPQTDMEIKVLDKIFYNGKEIKLKNNLYKSEDVFMIPVRELGESLGYKVSWKNVSRQAELTKGVNQVTATADKDMYSFSKMIVKLGKASEMKPGTMFVPVSFIEEAMKLEMEIDQDGAIHIK